MQMINAAASKFFDLVFRPFLEMTPWAAMAVAALLTAVLMLFVFRLTSNQAGVKAAKNRIKAHLLEMRLYRDQPSVIFRAQGRILLANLNYMGHNARPLAVMIIPLVLILAHLNTRFGYEALNTGEPFLLKVLTSQNAALPSDMELRIDAPAGIVIETPPVRIDDEREAVWRLSARESGPTKIAIRAGSDVAEKSLAVGTSPLKGVFPRLDRKSVLDQFLYPGDAPMPRESSIRRVEIAYPPARMDLFGWKMHWIIPYFVLSLVFGFALKGPFKVEI